MKCKKTVKNKKAFTLVELVGVLVVIGILNIILIPVISKSLKNSRQKLYDKQIDAIILAAKAFASDYEYVLPEGDQDIVKITLGQLKDTGYIDKEVKNPFTKEEFSECMLISITNNSGNYDYAVETENIPESCDRISSVAISDPSKRFINKDSISSYIITVVNETDLFTNYNLDKDKITLNNNIGAKYNITGENGIYKLTVYSGNTEGEVSFSLNNGAITDESGNSVIQNQLSPSKSVIVDLTAPVITFGTNGNNSPQLNQSSTIMVDDYSSGLDNNSLKYIYSQDIDAIPQESFISYYTYSISRVSGDYYLIAEACDVAGNCTREVSNVFKLDIAGSGSGSEDRIVDVAVEYTSCIHGPNSVPCLKVTNRSSFPVNFTIAYCCKNESSESDMRCEIKSPKDRYKFYKDNNYSYASGDIINGSVTANDEYNNYIYWDAGVEFGFKACDVDNNSNCMVDNI